MYRKDLITAEIQKLAEVLAKIMGLKLEGKFNEAGILFNNTIESGFGLPLDILHTQELSIFESWLKESNLPPEKLDSLSEFLYYELGVGPERNAVVAPKLNVVYNYLSDEHKIVHLVNLHRQKTIQQYL